MLPGVLHDAWALGFFPYCIAVPPWRAAVLARFSDSQWVEDTECFWSGYRLSRIQTRSGNWKNVQAEATRLRHIRSIPEA